MPATTDTIRVPREPAERPEDQRAIHLPSFLQRILPYYGQPAYLDAQRWRAFVKNQPIALLCRDTLISNMLNMEWDIVPREAADAGMDKIKKSIDYYKELLTYLEGDFDNYLDLLLQDMLDLPFGAASEVGRYDDEPDMPVEWAEHIDAATLFPTGQPEYPVAQRVPEVPGVQVVFPEYAINRMYLTPRTEIRLKGWGMAPPQKVYVAIEMLFRGDQYYWKLLLDTPEAGILDLINMTEDAATKWLDGFRDIFQGIDGFKIPVLYGHDEPAQWIPLNRPPTDLLYDTQYIKYAQIVSAAYGIRLSDLGLEEAKGGGTLAGVIRGERQTKRTGRAVVRSKTENHFNWMLPVELKFIWKDKDAEDATERGRGMTSLSQGLKIAVDSGMLSKQEGRAELVASGVLDTDLDPNEMPVQENPMGMMGMGSGAFPPNGGSPATAPAGTPVNAMPVPATMGGRGGPTPVGQFKSLVERKDGTPPEQNIIFENDMTTIERMEHIIKPGLNAIYSRAEDPRLRRLIKAATREMFEDVALNVRSLTDEQIYEIWLPEVQAATFDQPSEIESPMVRRDIEEAKGALESHLADDPWWSMLDVIDKNAVLRLFVEAYESGLGDMALSIVRALYEEGMRSSATLPIGISFNLTNTRTLGLLERSAAELVRRVDEGTKFFLKRMVVAGVRQGLTAPDIARAIRDGDRADAILSREDYLDDVSGIVRDGLIDMTEYRSNSIVNTEINRAQNKGRREQMSRSGFKTKKWVHRGSRGTTRKGNIHPCPVCLGNEELGVVPMEHAFKTVFKTGGVDGEGGEYEPPGHPGVCHCEVTFEKQELFDLSAAGDFMPYLGGKN